MSKFDKINSSFWPFQKYQNIRTKKTKTLSFKCKVPWINFFPMGSELSMRRKGFSCESSSERVLSTETLMEEIPPVVEKYRTPIYKITHVEKYIFGVLSNTSRKLQSEISEKDINLYIW